MYNVVFKNTSGSISDGVITWTSFVSKAHFDEWYNEKMKDWYKIVREGVSEEQAIELCSSTKATLAVLISELKELVGVVGHIDSAL